MSIADTTNLFLTVAPRVAHYYGYTQATVWELIAFILTMMPSTFSKWYKQLGARRVDWLIAKLIELLPA